MSIKSFSREGNLPPFQTESAQQAAFWLTCLMSDQVKEQDRIAWQQWRAASHENEIAWQHIESACARFSQLDAAAAHCSLSTFHAGQTLRPTRRSLLKTLAVVGVSSLMAAAGSPTGVWQRYRADYQTRIGEQRQVTLEEGSTLLLNTQSAINVDYNDDSRQVRLEHGEVMIETGQAEKQRAFPRPFIVMTDQGRVQALGTRFSLSTEAERTQVAVFDGAVRLCPSQGSEQARVITAGNATWFTRSHCGPTLRVHREPAWVAGQLLADNQRLGDFLDELSRYRQGVIRYDPGVAGLRLSGVFPLSEKEHILSSLKALLPIQIHSFSRYWIQVSRV